MKRRAAIFVFLAMLLAAPTRAQNPTPPADDETPTLTNDDVPSSPSTNLGSATGAPSLDAMWEEAYKGMERSGATAADIAQVRSVIDGGGEIGFAVRFDVGPDGRIANFVTERRSGITSVDREVGKSADGQMLGAQAANFRDIRIDLGVTKTHVRLNASATAPTVEKAAELERELAQARSNASSNAAASSLLSGISLTRQGATLLLTANLSLAELIRGR
jgi:hypothetical protein